MSKEESLKLLLQRQPRNDEEVTYAYQIALLLGYLALALDQAGAYIRARRLNLRDFIPEYERRKDLILQEIPDEWEYSRSIDGQETETRLRVFTTWELSYQQLSGNEHDKMYKDHLLTLTAFFDTKLLSARYFQALFNSERFDWMDLYQSEDAWNNSKLRDVLAEFQKLSLLQLLETKFTEPSFSVHPVVRDWIKLRKTKNERQEYAAESMTALTSYLESVDIDDLALETKQETMLHVDACIQNDAEFRTTHLVTCIDRQPYSASSFAHLYWNQGRYDEAEELYGRALAGRKKKLGAEHPETLRTVQNLANVYYSQGRYGEAEELYQRFEHRAK